MISYNVEAVERIIAHESRVIHLAWDSDKQAFEIRLMYGRRFITPKHYLDALGFRALIDDRPVRFEGWFSLGKVKGRLTVFPLREFVYGAHGDELVPRGWPPVSFSGFYNAAKRERGVAPEEGWHRIHEQQEEAKRDQWD